ncbi:DUF523 domain-containing protein [Ancylomarina euxinus]|uniref:DUF523 domain-containing protein n=1 Tax=Ancylomarina euxinus TaxID=2283627 RepID=A0A425XY87_9BACT|nr:DUF523 domain-containing protein [Ancylomarina euxinus]RRG19760.1 DUF523 domain-containing protein [Ancylomarina euxinus]
MYLISACLLGVNCRYNGTSIRIFELDNLIDSGRLIPVCPEVLGGLATPREACEIITQNDGSKKVMTESGLDYTSEFQIGAKRVLDIAQTCDVRKVILKANSPSCGCGNIYDGTFSGKLIEGNGLSSQLLLENGIEVYNEHNWAEGEFV